MKPAIKNLELRLRGMMPSIVRKTYRVMRSFGEVNTSRSLLPELVEDCRFCASRIHMLDHLPHGGIVAELGTRKGDFAREIFSRTEPRELHLIDLDYSKFSSDGLVDDRVHQHRGFTHEIIASFENDTFDWIYIDADHSYEGALRDACAAAEKIKPDGYIVFNDFAHIDPYLGRYGVHRAVVDFALERAWPLRLFAFHTSALYDVALQKSPNRK
ncbi:MAG: class I SAM-dependent methyltransferase [bacterium]|nr:class I SAM-dependent methyltransferase [bacterium]